jgi:N-acetyl-gamma-glutamyl-phosphate reductase
MKVSVIGATGYTGVELLRLLSAHPKTDVAYITSENSAGSSIAEVYPHLAGAYGQKLANLDQLDEIAEKSDLLFIGLPHGHAMRIVSALAGRRTRIVDLGADYRLKDPAVYEAWYKVEHTDKDTRAAYGLCELYRDEVRTAKVVANPGCYVTASILALAPLLKHRLIETAGLVIDAKSGATGAGRGLALGMHFPEVTDSFRPYGAGNHRHTPEIEEIYSSLAGEKVVITFVPHLLPIDRGIIATCYAAPARGVTAGDIDAAFRDFYAGEYFVRLLGRDKYPVTKAVRGSNFTDIGWVWDERAGRLIVMSALDNLVKGASGQAVQNMNIMFGWDETAGLNQLPLYP